VALKLQLLAIFASGVLLGIVFELLRRRRLIERYALIWLGSSLVLLGLAIWKGALDRLADLMGIAYPPNALFMIAFGFVLLLLLHFSLAISRLSNETKVLAQVVARLDRELRELRGRPAAEPAPAVSDLREETAAPERETAPLVSDAERR
jgi:hypothetical protein